uniref:Cytochrome b5 heme-binding domain-containing protein n=1 Tax=Leptobrachium leishanense TaxID=445787 RepID=A0A8C5QBH0_9ANUR
QCEQTDSSKSPVHVFSQYTRADVKQHASLADRVWVTYAGEVFDITEFVELHPGGNRIMLAAGGALEPFWALHGVHKSKHVNEILQEYKVGELRPEEKIKAEDRGGGASRGSERLHVEGAP